MLVCNGEEGDASSLLDGQSWEVKIRETSQEKNMSACVSPASYFTLLETRQRRVGFEQRIAQRRESIFVFSRMRIREMERDGSPRRRVNNPRRASSLDTAYSSFERR